MLRKIITVGNSAAITLLKGFLEDVGLKAGDKIRGSFLPSSRNY
ncbi:MAG: hypothetical protein ABIB61_03085 [Candidatus Shapirobacteria bacterium]